MSERIVHDPQSTGEELPVPGAVDTSAGTGTTPGSRPGAVHLLPFLGSGVELGQGPLNGLFNRFETVFSGIADGFRVGRLVAALPASVTNTLTAIFNSSEESEGALELVLSKLNILHGDNQIITADTYTAKQIAYALGLRKVVGIDAGAYVAPAVAGSNAVTFTGVNLLGKVWFLYNITDQSFHRITAVVDPAGGAVGTLTLATPIISANATLFIPFSSTPHAWNSAVDALQTLAVAGDPPRINGPATFLSVAAANIANGTTQYILPTAMYARQGIQIVWTCAGATLLTFNIFGKIDDAAWAAAGAIPAAYNINTWMQTTAGGVAFGAPPLGGAVANIINARIQDPTRWNSIAIEMTASASAGNSTVTGTEVLGGGTA